MNERPAPFRGSTGLADDINVEFRNVTFGTDPGYTNDDGDMIPLCLIDFATDDESIGQGGVLENQFVTIGSGWEIVDNGAKVQRANGSDKGFNTSTYLQQIIDHAFNCEGGEEALIGRFESTGLTPQVAAFWEGFRCHMSQTTIKVYGDQTRDRLLPDKVTGWGGGGSEAETTQADKPAAKPAAKKAAKKKAVAKKAAAKPVSEYAARMAEVDAAVVALIRSVADESESADDFINNCYDGRIDGIEDDENVQYLVDDTDSPDSIWAVAVAEYEAG